MPYISRLRCEGPKSGNDDGFANGTKGARAPSRYNAWMEPSKGMWQVDSDKMSEKGHNAIDGQRDGHRWRFSETRFFCRRCCLIYGPDIHGVCVVIDPRRGSNPSTFKLLQGMREGPLERPNVMAVTHSGEPFVRAKLLCELCHCDIKFCHAW